MHGLNLLDILLWIILLLFAVKGFMKGLVREVCTLLGVVAGAWAAFTYYGSLAGAVRALINLPQSVVAVISFLIIYLVIGLLFYFVGHLLTVILKIMLMGWLNRLGGTVFGFLQAAFVLCILLALIAGKPAPAKIKGYLTASTTAQCMTESGRDMIAGWKKRRSASTPAKTH